MSVLPELHYLPFWFTKLSNGIMVLVNQGGEHLFINLDDFNHILNKDIDRNSDFYFALKDKQFLADDYDLEIQLDVLANQLKSRKAYLDDFTSLHMIVVTARCNFNCRYCHASSANEKEHDLDLDWPTAKLIVNKIFESPSPIIKIEFQGGEPLLNWPIIQDIVEYAEIVNCIAKRQLEFVICTNLTLITKEILEYCKSHNIAISTSLDGNQEIQNYNRKPRGPIDGYKVFEEKLALTRSILGQDGASPLLTVSKTNLNRLPLVVDEYIKHDFHGIFIRALNPYGNAVDNVNTLGYSTEEFLKAYKNALNYIIQKNIEGYYFVEYYAALLLERILTPFSTGFVDLQSPCGNIISGVIYDYNGYVYASDEGRMLARRGDKRFCLGHVGANTWNELFKGNLAKEVVKASCVECLPECATCAYQLYCGADPVRYYAENGTLEGHRPSSSFCQKTKGALDYIFYLLSLNDDRINKVFWSWINY